MPLYRRLPKRGFRSFRNKNRIAIINLSKIKEILSREKSLINNKINLLNLKKNKFVNKKFNKLKVLGSGEINLKLDIEVNSISKSAKAKIEKLGGKVTLIK